VGANLFSPPKGIGSRAGFDLGPVVHHPLQVQQAFGMEHPQHLGEQLVEGRWVPHPEIRQAVVIDRFRPVSHW